MGLWVILLALQEEPSTFGVSRAEVPVVARPDLDAAFGRAHAEVPVVASPDLRGSGWSLPSYRARLFAESYTYLPPNFLMPSLSSVTPPLGPMLQSSISLSPPAAPAAPVAVPGGGGGRP